MSKKAKRILALLNDPKLRHRLMGDVNLLDQDEPAKVGGDQEINVLKEMNELEEFRDENSA